MKKKFILYYTILFYTFLSISEILTINKEITVNTYNSIGSNISKKSKKLKKKHTKRNHHRSKKINKTLMSSVSKSTKEKILEKFKTIQEEINEKYNNKSLPNEAVEKITSQIIKGFNNIDIDENKNIIDTEKKQIILTHQELENIVNSNDSQENNYQEEKKLNTIKQFLPNTITLNTKKNSMDLLINAIIYFQPFINGKIDIFALYYLLDSTEFIKNNENTLITYKEHPVLKEFILKNNRYLEITKNTQNYINTINNDTDTKEILEKIKEQTQKLSLDQKMIMYLLYLFEIAIQIKKNDTITHDQQKNLYTIFFNSILNNNTLYIEIIDTIDHNNIKKYDTYLKIYNIEDFFNQQSSIMKNNNITQKETKLLTTNAQFNLYLLYQFINYLKENSTFKNTNIESMLGNIASNLIPTEDDKKKVKETIIKLKTDLEKNIKEYYTQNDLYNQIRQNKLYKNKLKVVLTNHNRPNMFIPTKSSKDESYIKNILNCFKIATPIHRDTILFFMTQNNNLKIDEILKLSDLYDFNIPKKSHPKNELFSYLFESEQYGSTVDGFSQERLDYFKKLNSLLKKEQNSKNGLTSEESILLMNNNINEDGTQSQKEEYKKYMNIVTDANKLKEIENKIKEEPLNKLMEYIEKINSLSLGKNQNYNLEELSNLILDSVNIDFFLNHQKSVLKIPDNKQIIEKLIPTNLIFLNYIYSILTYNILQKNDILILEESTWQKLENKAIQIAMLPITVPYNTINKIANNISDWLTNSWRNSKKNIHSLFDNSTTDEEY